MTVRSILSIIGLAFTAYLAARGLIWTSPETVERGWLIVAALVLYLPVTWLWIFAIGARDRRAEATATTPAMLPGWGVALALIVTVVVSNAPFLAVSESGRTQPFVTWVIGAIGALMTIVMVRRRPVVAWAGMGILTVSTSIWLGPLQALSLGLVGSFVWVTAAQLVTLALDRAARDAERLAELQQAASAWQASQSGRQRERRLHVQRALQAAGPILARTIENGGNLRAADKQAARRAEASLRDELRGTRLLDDGVRAEIDAARRRGAPSACSTRAVSRVWPCRIWTASAANSLASCGSRCPTVSSSARRRMTRSPSPSSDAPRPMPRAQTRTTSTSGARSAARADSRDRVRALCAPVRSGPVGARPTTPAVRWSSSTQGGWGIRRQIPLPPQGRWG